MTPLMQQYSQLKAQAQNALLLFRMGDFYELFGEDAEIAARILNITLTSRDKNKEDALPMAGVPHHSLEPYLQKLLQAGYKVAIAEQVGDPASAKGIVKREVVRTFTPAVRFDSSSNDSFYLATVEETSSGIAFAALDPSTGQIWVDECASLAEIFEKSSWISIQHWLLPKKSIFPHKEFQKEGVLVEDLAVARISHSKLDTQFREMFVIGRDFKEEVLTCVIKLVDYVLKSQNLKNLTHLQAPQYLGERDSFRMGPKTPEHLDLQELFALVNHCSTSSGARRLKEWVMKPLTSLNAIHERQNTLKALSELNRSHQLRSEIKKHLATVYDLERILGRISTGLASPRDTLALGESLESVDPIHTLWNQVKTTYAQFLNTQIELNISPLRSLRDEIRRFQKSPAPHLSREGGIFAKGYHPELDHLIDLSENGEQWLLKFEAQEKQRTGISSLKVRYNRVFGYYIEVTKVNLSSIPVNYQRKQSMANAERFFTEELKKYEEEILSATTKRSALELELFQQLISKISTVAKHILEISHALSQIDALVSLSEVASWPGWNYPELSDGLSLNIQSGRHPLVEKTLGSTAFVPNDIRFDSENLKIHIITGPNMGGKSTIMRQTALIIILGQMGAAVPALSAQWGLFSSIYTRIGAHDSIATGQSTFMVEMNELAHLLKHADERSLLILDEIGRGTSTYDGMSVAWATLEWISTQIRARTLFATHYHELTHLAGELPALANSHLAVQSNHRSELKFLYILRDGPSSESFGIHVAAMAGLPEAVIQRSWKILESLEQAGSSHHVASSLEKLGQLSLFGGSTPPELPHAPKPHPVLTAIEEKNLNEITPLEALNFLSALKSKLSPLPDSESKSS